MTLYPFYTDSSIGSMANFAFWASDASGRPVMVCEVGYPWTLDPQHPEAGEVTLIESKGEDPDGPENYGATPAGQQRYLQEYFRAMNSTGDVVAVVYWDPIWLDLAPGADPNGWQVGNGSVARALR
jgi:arabinogalactan endo-1,4-beta-galactosidase